MGLFVVAVSLVENALNPMRCKILYSHYILSSAAISHYMKSSFKFTLVWAIWLGYILRCKDVLNWLVLSQRSSGSVQWQTTLPLKRSFFPRCDWWKPAEQPHVHQSYYKTTTWLGTTCSISRKEARRILIWIEVTRWRNTGQGSRDTCSASLLIRSTSKGWCSSHPEKLKPGYNHYNWGLKPRLLSAALYWHALNPKKPLLQVLYRSEIWLTDFISTEITMPCWGVTSHGLGSTPLQQTAYNDFLHIF